MFLWRLQFSKGNDYEPAEHHFSKTRRSGISTEEIQFFVRGYTNDDIADYQAAAWLMTIHIRDMSPHETVDLTMAMAHSGEILDLSGVLPFALDKQSSGGVGD